MLACSKSAAMSLVGSPPSRDLIACKTAFMLYFHATRGSYFPSKRDKISDDIIA